MSFYVFMSVNIWCVCSFGLRTTPYILIRSKQYFGGREGRQIRGEMQE